MTGFVSKPRHARFMAFAFFAMLFLTAVGMGLLIPLYAGLLAYAIVLRLSGSIVDEHIRSARSKWIATALVATLVVGVLAIAGIILHFFLSASTDLHDLMLKMSEILISARSWLPETMGDVMPQQSELLAKLSDWLRMHAAAIGTFGLGAVKGIGLALFGVLLGAMIAVTDASNHAYHGPVTKRLSYQIMALRDCLWRVATAQIKISALNTTLTAIYLLLVLPAFGVQLPLGKTLIVVAFIAGLLPVVGNLISNTAITIISLSLSLQIALASLVFLILVHKLEYFVNARIVGTQINARAWEILLWMLIMERLFGIPGVVAAPVFYAWLKEEWHVWDMPEAAEADIRQG